MKMSPAPAEPGAQNIDFRTFLQRELVRRCKANPKYSLRAFARLLGVDSSRLSKILRGERPVRRPLIEKMGQRLGLSLAEIEGFKQRAAVSRAAETAFASSEPRDFRQITLDAFEVISEWQHYAILELMKVEGFKTEPAWIARRLGATPHEIRACVERLQRVGLLRILADGSWEDTSDGFSTHMISENVTSYAHRRAQAEILRLALRALEDVPIERRDQSSMMMATHSSRIVEAKRRITAFRRELCAFLEDAPEKDTVYQLSVSLFPLLDPAVRLEEPTKETLNPKQEKIHENVSL